LQKPVYDSCIRRN